MKRWTCLLGSALVLAGCAGSGTPAGVESAVAGGGNLLQMVNRLRASEGLPALMEDARLEQVALQHSRDQAQLKKTSHFGVDGGSYAYRLQQAGFSRTASESAAENVAYAPNPGGAQRALRAWGSSGNDRRHFLQPEHTHAGIAEVDGYWTVLMANPSL